MRRAWVALTAMAMIAASALYTGCRAHCGAPDEDTSGHIAEQHPSERPERLERQPPASDAQEPSERVIFDLARHRARAEVRHRGALAVDFGTPSGARHTLGGWRTRTGAGHTFTEGSAATTTRLLEGVTGEVLLPIESREPQELTLRLRGFGGDGRLTLYVDEITVGHARLPTDGSFVTLQQMLPALEPGEHALQLRVTSVGRADGLRAGLALDAMRIGSPMLRSGAADVSLKVPTRFGDGSHLEVPRTYSLGFGMALPAAARFRGRVRAGRIRVTAHRDGSAPRDLGTYGEGAFDIDLSPVGDAFVRLDVDAGVDGEARLERPRVVVLRPANDPAERARAPRKPKHVVVYLVDTVRADKLRPWNSESRVDTPGLDQWVRRATVFGRAHAQENWTKPSVATLLTGMLPWQHTATSDEAALPGAVDTLAERLKGRGFRTAAFVANGYVSDAFGFEQGFSSFRNYIRQGLRSQARFVAADVIAWLDDHLAHHREEPFFLYVHTIDPHVPYIPPPDLLERYDPDPYDGPVDFTRDRGLLEKVKAESLRLNDRDKQRLEALYDGEISYHDTHFASVIEALRRRELLDETLLVFTADHGEEFFDHGSVGHGHSLYEELLHVPLVMQVPGVGAARVDEPVGLVDIAPTVLDALQVPRDESLAGRSVLPRLAGETPDAPTLQVAGFMEGWRALISDRYKLIQRTHRRAFVYDLKADPHEQNDLAPSRPLLLRHLRAMLGFALEGHGAPRVEATAARVDGELREQLRALGYVGASAPPTRSDAEEENEDSL